MRTLDIPRTIALLKPLTAAPDITVRLVGIDETTDARIVSKSMIGADEHFIPRGSIIMSRRCHRRIPSP